MHREPEVQEVEAQVGKWLDCRARITSQEHAPIHSVKSGTLRSACSTSPKMDAELEKSALMRIATLMNGLAKGLKRMVTKSAVAMLKITRLQFCANRLARGMAKADGRPLEPSEERAVRYLKVHGRWVQEYRLQDPTSMIDIFTDSDWAGDR